MPLLSLKRLILFFDVLGLIICKEYEIYNLFIKNPYRSVVYLDIDSCHSVYGVVKTEINLIHSCATFILRNGSPTMTERIQRSEEHTSELQSRT